MDDFLAVEDTLKSGQGEAIKIEPDDVRLVKDFTGRAITCVTGVLGNTDLPADALIANVHDDQFAAPRDLLLQGKPGNIDAGPAHFDDSALHSAYTV